jgi:hypothetical protein
LTFFLGKIHRGQNGKTGLFSGKERKDPKNSRISNYCLMIIFKKVFFAPDLKLPEPDKALFP